MPINQPINTWLEKWTPKYTLDKPIRNTMVMAKVQNQVLFIKVAAYNQTVDAWAWPEGMPKPLDTWIAFIPGSIQ